MRIKNHEPFFWHGHPIKEGDELLCIRNFPDQITHTGAVEHTAGKVYKVLYTAPHVVEIVTDFGWHQQYMHNDDLPANRRVWEYFEPPLKTQRRLKLKKIQEFSLSLGN